MARALSVLLELSQFEKEVARQSGEWEIAMRQAARDICSEPVHKREVCTSGECDTSLGVSDAASGVVTSEEISALQRERFESVPRVISKVDA